MDNETTITTPPIDDDSKRGKRELPGVFVAIGELPPGALVTEDGLAGMLGKECRESIKRAVARGEFPPPVKIMGKNTWTAGAIVRHVEDRLESEARKVAKLRPSA